MTIYLYIISYYIIGDNMKKIFKSKKKLNFKLSNKLKLLLISFSITFFIYRFDIIKSEKFINFVKNISLNKINIKKLDLKSKYLLNIGLNTFDDISFTKEVFKEKEKVVSEEAPTPLVYIYNTHQTEEYKTIENYNLTPTVLTASYILKDKLNDYNIGSIVESSDLKTDLNKMGYTYRDAYKVSRKWLENLNNPNLSLYIDLHRDSIKYSLSNINVNGSDYAKIMFVVGTNYDYSKNMQVAESLVKEIESINKDISRGIFTRKSVYNQDYNPNCILVEIGGPESTYSSISNTLDVLALAIKNYIGD